ncbi:MAG: hypothetical protein ACHQNT_06225 [Bacteroidia bacterium]
MKNKKTVYILLPLAVLIWGIIIYKIILSLSPDETAMSSEQFNLPAATSSNAPDTFSIIANYRDPFLGKQASLNPAPVKALVIKKTLPPVSKPWPDIKYNGTMKNASSKKEFAFVQINGKEYIMKLNEEEDDIKLLKIFKDSAVVAFGKEKKTVVK